MGKEQIRPIAICVFRRDNRILVGEGYDPVKKAIFYRPLGGRIEFGEYSHETIAREIEEEISAEVTNLRYLGAIENIFTFNGQVGHEIVQVYDGDFVDSSLYTREQIQGYEMDEEWEGNFRAVWKSLETLREGDVPLYPDDLLGLLLED